MPGTKKRTVHVIADSLDAAQVEHAAAEHCPVGQALGVRGRHIDGVQQVLQCMGYNVILLSRRVWGMAR